MGLPCSKFKHPRNCWMLRTEIAVKNQNESYGIPDRLLIANVLFVIPILGKPTNVYCLKNGIKL